LEINSIDDCYSLDDVVILTWRELIKRMPSKEKDTKHDKRATRWPEGRTVDDLRY